MIRVGDNLDLASALTPLLKHVWYRLTQAHTAIVDTRVFVATSWLRFRVPAGAQGSQRLRPVSIIL
jgi:hypothetical protein